MVISTVKSQTYDTTFYNEDSGLTQWHVTQMLQDHNGMMWFSTWNGLNRFDGKEFIAFKSKAGDGSNMPTDRIRDMILAKNNDIYCRVDETWYRFSQKDGKLTSWLPPTAPQMRFRKIFRKGNVLLGATTEGLFVADIKNKKFILHQKEANRVNSMSSSACMNILEYQGHLYQEVPGVKRGLTSIRLHANTLNNQSR